MARLEEDRDDLYAELISYPLRCELHCNQTGETLVVGIRPGQRWVVYRQTGDYYQFLPTGELRRAFAGRSTLLSTGNTLATLTKVRSESETTLLRRDLSEAELNQFLDQMQEFLQELESLLMELGFQVLRQSPPDAEIIQEISPLISAARTPASPLSPAVAR